MSVHVDFRRSPITGDIQVWCQDRRGWYVILYDDQDYRALCRGCLGEVTERLKDSAIVELPKLAA